MTDTTPDQFGGLLARARAAIASTDVPNPALLADLAEAGQHIAVHPVPWTVDAHVGLIEHRHGRNLYVAFSREALIAEIANFCREHWSEIRDDRDPAKLTDEDVASIYFDGHDEEYLQTERIPVEGPAAGGAGPLRIGCHLVISTSHIRPSTADLLDQWAQMLPAFRPLGVAESGHGWFVLTDPLDGEARMMVPPELLAAIDFARRQGCRWLLLDRDADCVDGLETFDW
jgi:hypothetical protein